MSFIEHKDSESNDSDVFVIEQVKPYSKITFQETLTAKFGILRTSNSKTNKKKQKEKFRQQNTCSSEKKFKKKKVASFVGENFQKKLIKSEGDKNITETCTSNKEFNCNWNTKSDVNKLENEIKTNNIKKNLYNDNEKLIHARKSETITVSNLSTNNVTRNAEEIQVTPGISRKQKRFKIIETSPKPTSPKKRIRKPLIKVFNMLEDECFLVKKEPEIDKRNSANMEVSSEFSVHETKSHNIVEKTLKVEDYFHTNEYNFFENESNAEEFFCYDEFQSKIANSMNMIVEKDMEKFDNNSELLCFLLKKIIYDETKKQMDLEKQSLINGKKVEKLLSETECKILEKFFYLEKNVCKVFVRMLGRKKDWHRVSAVKYEDIGDNLENEFKVLKEENFVDINVEEESLETQMDLLSKAEILKLCKTFNVFCKSINTYKKEILIKSLIENSRKQISVLDMFHRKKGASRIDVIKTEVKSTLGFCVRIKSEVFKVFHKILVLFSFAHYYDEEDKRFSNQLFLCYQVHKNMVKFPTYKLSPTTVFATQADFEEYEKSLLIQDSFEIAISNKNYDEFVFVFNKAKDEFKKLLNNQNYQNRYLKLKPFLQKFSAGAVYARILTNYCKKFKKKTNNLEIISTIQLLLGQNIFLLRKRGEWYEILSKAFEMEKQTNAAAEVLIKSMSDPLINEVQKLTLQLRGQHILKKKTGGINDAVLREMLEGACISSVQEPTSIEIRGKVLDGNESGFKSVYIQDFQHGKIFTSVEERAITYYKSNGFTRGYHAEGFLVQTIYFILFYDIIYKSSSDGVFQTPFQEAPLDLYSASFYLNRKEHIDSLLSEMLSWNDHQIETKIRDVYCMNYNTNCVIKWNNEFTPELFCEIIKCITMPILIHIFQRFIKDFRVVQSGFPDLTLWNPEINKCKFVEVKSPNDKLSPAQRIWLDYLTKIGLDCEVCNVKNISSKSIGRIV